MAQELILLEDVEGLGTFGERVRVAEGYARNYLLPRKLAARVTPENLKQLELRKQKMQEEYEQRVSVAESLAERISRISVTIPMQAGENDKLYGSVTAAQVVDALSEEGIQIDRHNVVLDEPIRELGVYTVTLQLHPQVQTSVKVWVVRA